jgi:hypothetical protein
MCRFDISILCDSLSGDRATQYFNSLNTVDMRLSFLAPIIEITFRIQKRSLVIFLALILLGSKLDGVVNEFLLLHD